MIHMQVEQVEAFQAGGGTSFGDAWSPDSADIAVAGFEGGLHVWNVASRQLRWAAPSDDLLSCVDWSRDGQALAAGSSGGKVVVFDRSGARRHSVDAHGDEVRSVGFSPDGTLLASGANDGLVCVWRSADLGLVARIRAHSGPTRSVAWLPDGRGLASGGHDATVRLWSADGWSPWGGLADHRGAVCGVAISCDGRLLASASMDSSARIWDLNTSGYVSVLDHFDTWWVLGVSFSPSGQHIAVIDQNPTVHVFDLSDGADGNEVGAWSAKFGSTSVTWSPDGKHVSAPGFEEQIWKVLISAQ